MCMFCRSLFVLFLLVVVLSVLRFTDSGSCKSKRNRQCNGQRKEGKRTNGQTAIYKALYRKLKIEWHESYPQCSYMTDDWRNSSSDNVYQLLAHGRLFSPASSTTKTGRHDIAEILLKVALSTKNHQSSITHWYELRQSSVMYYQPH
jgi:hypothetical protein